MATIFTTGQVNEVFFRIGKFDTGKGKFIHAPFDLLTLSGVLYLNTRAFGQAAGSLPALTAEVGQSVTVDEEFMSSRDIFPTELNPVVLGEHEMGDFAGRGQDWVGMHKLGFI